MYVKQRGIAIKDATRPNETGSLFNPDDERNYLFTATGPLNVGRFLRVKIVPGREGGGRHEEAGKKGGAGGKEALAGKTGKERGTEAKPDELEAELLKSLPQLEPAERGELALLKGLKMQILHRYDNGDVLAMAVRRSVDADQGNEIQAQARIPYDRLSSGDELTTDDLLDVHFRESKGGELVERNSSSWEDEYSLRFSGFDEARSKAALELADQRKQLKDSTEKLETRIKTFGEERQQFAKQREDLIKAKKANDDKVQNLEDKVKEQQDTIEKQQEEIQTLSPEDKPGDGKEATGG
jgi:hypothetical protein